MERYFITDPSYYDSLRSFEEYLTSVYKNNQINFSCFRDKTGKTTEPYIELFLKISQRFGIKKTILNSSIDERFYGVHLTSKQFDLIPKAKEKNLFTVVSTHSFDEIKEVKNLGADAITFSPIFSTPNKGEPKGVDELIKAVKLSYPLKCFALGGIVSKEHIEMIKVANPFGFASIRYFIVK